jgi:hypothetical protein
MTAQAFESHHEFEGGDSEYAVTTAQFEATVTVGEPHRLRAELPTLDAVVVGESVADVVEEGWFDTFRRRIEDLSGVTTGSVESPAVSREGRTVVVEVAFDGKAPADDAVALLNSIEGTWFQGVVPGYDYRGDVQAMRERAHQRGGQG